MNQQLTSQSESNNQVSNSARTVSELLDGNLPTTARIFRHEGRNFSELFSWSDANALLNVLPLDHPSLKILKNGKQIYPSSKVGMTHLINQGASVIVNDLDQLHDQVGRFVSSVVRGINDSSRINMYIASPHTNAFGLHYDTHDFLILQVEGRKRWQVFPATEDSPTFYRKQHTARVPTQSECYLDCELSKGDILFVPRGHWHNVTTMDEPSMHFTLALFYSTGIDLLNWMVGELQETAQVRATLPPSLRGFRQKHRVDQQKERGNCYISDLTKIVTSFLRDETLLDRFAEHRRGTQLVRQSNNLPHSMIQELPTGFLTRELLPTPAGIHARLGQLHQNGEAVEIVALNQVVKLPSTMKELISTLTAGHSFTAVEVSKAINADVESVGRVCYELLRAGILEAR